MAEPKSALILGATGQTGQHLLHTLLASQYYARVGEYGRRVTSLDHIKTGKEKLEQHIIDFDKLDESGLGDGKWDVVFITLGTTRKAAGSVERFEKIDREYVIDAAKHAKSSDPQHSQRLVYLSSSGANSSAPFLYPKSKGLTEEGLAGLGYSDTVVFRPGFLQGTRRPEARLVEDVFGKVTNLLSYVTNSIEIQISTLGKAICLAGTLGSQALPSAAGATKVNLKDGVNYTIIGNAGAIALAKSEADTQLQPYLRKKTH